MYRRNNAAAPPLYLLVIVLIPIGAAIYIASTRFTDNRHAGFDVIFGSLEGLLCAWFAFRWFHPPIRNSAGWAWGSRHPATAFGINFGTGNYAGQRKRDDENERGDLEGGQISKRHREPLSIELSDYPTAGLGHGSPESQRPLV